MPTRPTAGTRRWLARVLAGLGIGLLAMFALGYDWSPPRIDPVGGFWTRINVFFPLVAGGMLLVVAGYLYRSS